MVRSQENVGEHVPLIHGKGKNQQLHSHQKEDMLSTSEKPRKGVCSMSTEDNKALVRRFFDEVINKKNLAAIDEFIDPQMVDHALPPGMPAGIEGQRQVFSMYTTAFPDAHFMVEDMIAEEDKVVARLSVSAT